MRLEDVRVGMSLRTTEDCFVFDLYHAGFIIPAGAEGKVLSVGKHGMVLVNVDGIRVYYALDELEPAEAARVEREDVSA